MNSKRMVLSLLMTAVMVVSAVPLTAMGGTADDAGSLSNSQQAVTPAPGRDFLLPVTTLWVAPDGYTPITSKADLYNMRQNLNGSYILMNDIEFTAADFLPDGAFYNEGKGWEPIGNYNDEIPFTGILNGNGYSITGLTSNIYIPATDELWISTGLFSYLSGHVQDLSMIDAKFRLEVKPDKFVFVGAIAGFSDGTIHNCVVTGSMLTPNHFAQSGGLVGENGKTVSYCKNYATVSCGQEAGGLVGDNGATISNCVNLGTVYATYSNGSAGGITGRNNDSITSCFNSGLVQGLDEAGGITASNFSPGIISNCFNTGRVESTGAISHAAGIACYNAGSIATCYNDAKVINVRDQYLAGVVYLDNYGTVTNCYYNSDLPSKGGGTPLTTTQMKNQSSFAGFDFAEVWQFNYSIRRPVLEGMHPDMYPITYVQNGGTLIPDDPTVYMMGSNHHLAIPTRAGYTFQGWFKDAGFLTKASSIIPQGTTGALTYYAKWGVPILAAKSYSYNSIKVTWAAAGGATSYKIYRATSANGDYSRVYIAPSTARSWVNTGLVTGKYYYYKVCPEVNGKSYYHTANKYAKPIPSAPTVTLSKYNSTSIKVSWRGVSGATKYQVFRSTSATGTYTYLYTASSTARSWVNTGRTPGKYYYYKVRAYHLEGTTRVYGYSSAVESIRI